MHKRGVALGDVFKLFGLRASASAAALIRNAEIFEEYIQRVSDITKLQKMFELQMRGLEAQAKKLKNAFDVMAMGLSEVFIPILRDVMSFLTALFRTIALAPEGVKRFLVLVGVFTAMTRSLILSYQIWWLASYLRRIFIPITRSTSVSYPYLVTRSIGSGVSSPVTRCPITCCLKLCGSLTF